MSTSLIRLVRLVRPYYAIPMSLAYTLTAYYALGGDAAGRWTGLWLSTVSLLSAIAAGYAFNEVRDVAVDRARPKGHPIASGEVSLRVGWIVSIALAAASILLAAATGNWPFVAATAAVLAGLGAYDAFSKRIGMGKQLLAAAMMTSIYPLAIAFAGWPVGPRAGSLIVFPIWLFVTSVGYELLKDIRDCRTDPPVPHLAGAIRYNPEWHRRLAGSLIAGASPVLLLCGYLGCGWVYLLGALGAICLAVLAAISPVRLAIRLTYAECSLVAIAAAADVVALGI